MHSNLLLYICSSYQIIALASLACIYIIVSLDSILKSNMVTLLYFCKVHGNIEAKEHNRLYMYDSDFQPEHKCSLQE